VSSNRSIMSAEKAPRWAIDMASHSADDHTIMGKKPPPATKYGAPLYAVAWPTQELLFIAGGGGKKSSGIKNRCLSLLEYLCI